MNPDNFIIVTNNFSQYTIKYNVVIKFRKFFFFFCAVTRVNGLYIERIHNNFLHWKSGVFSFLTVKKIVKNFSTFCREQKCWWDFCRTKKFLSHITSKLSAIVWCIWRKNVFLRIPFFFSEFQFVNCNNNNKWNKKFLHFFFSKTFSSQKTFTANCSKV